ncbi:ribosomal maturation YjgA family protein [Glutamicibacter sp.]|uniref:ribosomal maturation YjgA family protein n=1 Tax=Glutamicibacter sp. TaxID=1931995 RepID=UPI002FDAA19A
MASPNRRRLAMGISAVALIPIGLFLRFQPWGLISDLSGGILYASLIYVLVAFLVPTSARVTVGLWALGWCVAVELLQLTAFPSTAGHLFPPARLVLGTGFAATDLVAYLVGALSAFLVDLFWQRRITNSRY